MKKIISIIAALCVITIADAQNYDDAIIKSLRGGVTLSQKNISGIHSQMGDGFNLEFNYQKQLLDTYPIYLETGFGLNTKKTGQLLLLSNNQDESSYKPQYTFIGIPLLVNYKFFTNDDVIIYPSIGIALQAGLVRIVDGIEPLIDVPLRLGVTIEFQRKYIVSYAHESGMFYIDNDYGNMEGFFISNYITAGFRF